MSPPKMRYELVAHDRYGECWTPAVDDSYSSLTSALMIRDALNAGTRSVRFDVRDTVDGDEHYCDWPDD